MNIFIYDDFLNNKKYDKKLAQIETRITDLGLNGKIIRIGLLKNVFSAVDNEIKRGAKTIVAVGNNSTLNKVVNSLLKSDYSQTINIPVGIIPVGDNNDISEYLGIRSYQSACDILSARRIEKLDVGKINEDYFLSFVKINNRGTVIEIDKKFTIESINTGSSYIINFNTTAIPTPENIYSKPQDGKLELFIHNKNNNQIFSNNTPDSSLFPFKKIIITNQKSPIYIDGLIQKNTPCEISLAQKKINIIIGKERMF